MEFLRLHTFDVVTGLSGLTVVGQCVAVVLLLCLSYEISAKRRLSIVSWFARHALLLMFITALTATVGSLFFSDIALWTPCKDCWLQRIFMYPQVVLLAVALWKKDKHIAPYILFLSLIGAAIAIGHYHEQVQAALHPVLDEEGVNMLLKPCDASGVSCAKTQIQFTFGYITIPLMALTGFVLNAIGSSLLMRGKKAS